MDPWRARRALGVNEGRSCDRSIFPKSRGGPIRRYIKAGRIISNLYCRRIRARVRSPVRSFAREKKILSIPPSPRALILSLSFIVLLSARPPFLSKPLCKITSYTQDERRQTRGWEVRAAQRISLTALASVPRSGKGETRDEGRAGTRLSYAIANYRQFDPVITQFKVIGPRRALAPRESFVCIKTPRVRTCTRALARFMYVYAQCTYERQVQKKERERQRERGGERKDEEGAGGKRRPEEQRCSGSHLRDSAWMLLAPFDDRKLLIDQRARRKRRYWNPSRG